MLTKDFSFRRTKMIYIVDLRVKRNKLKHENTFNPFSAYKLYI